MTPFGEGEGQKIRQKQGLPPPLRVSPPDPLFPSPYPLALLFCGFEFGGFMGLALGGIHRCSSRVISTGFENIVRVRLMLREMLQATKGRPYIEYHFTKN